MTAWIPLGPARFRIRLHLGIALAAGGLAALGGDAWWRYLLILSALVVHELGHALAAAAWGARAVVSVWPIFGRADVATMSPAREGWVAAAGPAANLVAAAAFGGAGGGFDLALARVPPATLLFTAHLLMGLGNLLPLPGVDGGRILRALRARRG